MFCLNKKWLWWCFNPVVFSYFLSTKVPIMCICACIIYSCLSSCFLQVWERHQLWYVIHHLTMYDFDYVHIRNSNVNLFQWCHLLRINRRFHLSWWEILIVEIVEELIEEFFSIQLILGLTFPLLLSTVAEANNLSAYKAIFLLKAPQWAGGNKLKWIQRFHRSQLTNWQHLFALFDYTPALGQDNHLEFVRNDEFVLKAEESAHWWFVFFDFSSQIIIIKQVRKASQHGEEGACSENIRRKNEWQRDFAVCYIFSITSKNI